MAAIVISELTADRQQCDKTGILIFEKKKKLLFGFKKNSSTNQRDQGSM